MTVSLSRDLKMSIDTSLYLSVRFIFDWPDID